METRIKDIDFFATPPFSGFKNVGYYNHSRPWNWLSKCDYACFYCVIRGNITVYDKERTLEAYEGDVLFLRSLDEMMMTCEADDGSAYYFISFRYDETVDLMIDTLIKEAGVTKLFKDLYEANRLVWALSHFKVYTLFMSLVYALSSKTLKTDKDYSQTYHIRTAAEFINLNYEKKITVDDLCRVSGYSPAHLRRLFIKHYGISPREYISQRRVEAAMEMLKDTPMRTVEDIAEALGICSPSYFCKLFKEKVGLTPLEYKKNTFADRYIIQMGDISDRRKQCHQKRK